MTTSSWLSLLLDDGFVQIAAYVAVSILPWVLRGRPDAFRREVVLAAGVTVADFRKTGRLDQKVTTLQKSPEARIVHKSPAAVIMFSAYFFPPLHRLEVLNMKRDAKKLYCERHALALGAIKVIARRVCKQKLSFTTKWTTAGMSGKRHFKTSW